MMSISPPTGQHTLGGFDVVGSGINQCAGHASGHFPFRPAPGDGSFARTSNRLRRKREVVHVITQEESVNISQVKSLSACGTPEKQTEI
jgi:hypothetical protein